VSILEIKDLSHAYNGNASILHGVSFTVDPGEFLCVIGLSGSGKSTLLRSINRLVDPVSGEIWVPRTLVSAGSNDERINVLKLRSGDLRHVRRKIGMIFQQFNLAKRLSVIDNVLAGALGYKSALRTTVRAFTREERRSALTNLKRVGLLEHAYKRADELSGGEQQRVAIARTLMQQPAIILADEPVSSLDPRLSRVVLEILKRVCREDGITAVVSLHTLELTRGYADRVIGLKQGLIVFDGPISELSDAEVEAIYHRTD
jgi:phosphonate transport system ATP-binding protein